MMDADNVTQKSAFQLKLEGFFLSALKVIWWCIKVGVFVGFLYYLYHLYESNPQKLENAFIGGVTTYCLFAIYGITVDLRKIKENQIEIKDMIRSVLRRQAGKEDFMNYEGD